jgi:hypothetical protein
MVGPTRIVRTVLIQKITSAQLDARTKLLLSIFETMYINTILVQNSIKQMPPTKLSWSVKRNKLDLVRIQLSTNWRNNFVRPSSVNPILV